MTAIALSTPEAVLARLLSIATCEDEAVRRRRGASLLLLLDDALYLQAREDALALGVLDAAALRRIEVVRAQELVEPEWRVRAFAILDQPPAPTPAIERDGDEPDGTSFAESEPER